MAPELTVGPLEAYSDEAAAQLGDLMPILYPDHPGTPLDRDRLESIIASPERDIIVARDAGIIVAKATVNVVDTELYRKVHFDNFITQRELQGTGVGLAVWGGAVRWALAKEATKLTLTSDTAKAIGFYMHRGAKVQKQRYISYML